MPRVELRKIFRGLWVAAEINDLGVWTLKRSGITAGHARRRLERAQIELTDIMFGGYPG